MCDFPNVENNDLELEALSSFCEDWNRRINFLPELFRQGHTDESLILCCCYIEAIGKWLSKSELNGDEAFAKILLQYGENEIFGRLNPRRLLKLLHMGKAQGEFNDIPRKLAAAFNLLQDKFYPWEEIGATCRSALSDNEFELLDQILWMGTLAGVAYKITCCDGVHHGSITVWNCADTVLDFQLFYPALKCIFERARGLIMAGKLRIY
jgi:hypothetical protein